jgi:uncharacterized protein YjbI with pentapeptide repeats
LRYADLSDADLGNADLRDANLSDADLGYADLRDANLSGVLFAIYGFECGGVYITKSSIQIGRQIYKNEDLFNFTDDDIKKMKPEVVAFWNKNKEMIFNLHRKLTEKK